MSDSLHRLGNNCFPAITAALTYIVTWRSFFSSPFQSIASLIPTHLLDNQSSRVVAADPSALDASVPTNRPDLDFMPLANNCTDAGILRKSVLTLILPKP